MDSESQSEEEDDKPNNKNSTSTTDRVVLTKKQIRSERMKAIWARKKKAKMEQANRVVKTAKDKLYSKPKKSKFYHFLLVVKFD